MRLSYVLAHPAIYRPHTFEITILIINVLKNNSVEILQEIRKAYIFATNNRMLIS